MPTLTPFAALRADLLRPRAWVLVAASALCLGAQAQVVRCTDARTGQVTYTDGACTPGAAAREVAPRKSAEDILQERQQAAQALEQKQQRLQTEALAAQRDAAREAQRQYDSAQSGAAGRPAPQDYARSAACAQSRRNLDVVASSNTLTPPERRARLDAAQRQMDLDCLGPEGYAAVERARAAQPRTVVVQPPPQYPQQRPPPPPQLTHCTEFRCTDTQGRSYPRAGPGRLPGPQGTCRSAGGQAPC